MKKILSILGLLFPTMLLAQQPGAVTATAMGANGAVYANGTYQIQLVDANGNPVQSFQVGGGTITQTQFSGSLSSAGSLAVSLYANTDILPPAGTQWSFRVCSAVPTLNLPLVVTAQKCFTQAVTVSGAGDISVALNVSAPSLTTVNPVTGVGAFSTSVSAPILDMLTGAVVQELPNNVSSGATLNKLVCSASVAGVASAQTCTTASLNWSGIATGGATGATVGNTQFAREGQAPCVFDGTTVFGDYVQISTTVAGDCHDTGSTTYPTSLVVIGRVRSVNSGTGTTAIVDVYSPGIVAGSGGGSGISGATAGQALIAGSATTATSSKALAGSGAGITTGPTSSTNLDCAQFTGTAGQVADSGGPCATGVPSGAAGGDLSGTYPNPGVAKVNGASIPVSKTFVGTNGSGQFIDASVSIFQNTIYASKGNATVAGCTLNSNITTGGGTVASACLQAQLDYLGSHGGGTLVLDGVALLDATNVNTTNSVDGNVQTSALQTHTNVTINATVGGVFLQAASNCLMLGNNVVGDPAATFQTNMQVYGGTWNQNGPNQSKFEQGNAANGFNFAFWFGGFNGLTIQNVTIRNPVTFTYTLSNGTNAYLNNIAELVDTFSTPNTDAIHLMGTLSNVTVTNLAVTNSNDDVIAINTDEGVNSFVNSPTAYQIGRYPHSGGDISGLTVDTVHLITSTHFLRFIGYTVTGGTPTVSNINIRNVYGSISTIMQNSGITTAGAVNISGWNLTGTNGFSFPVSVFTAVNIQGPSAAGSPGLNVNGATNPAANSVISTLNIPGTDTNVSLKISEPGLTTGKTMAIYFCGASCVGDHGFAMNFTDQNGTGSIGSFNILGASSGLGLFGTGHMAVGPSYATDCGSFFCTSTMQASLINTTTNCANAASPAVCGAAPDGAVTIAAGATTVVVNTTAVTANSRIFLQTDDTVTIAATTCNSTLATLVGGVAVTARTAGTSFTISFNGVIATNPLCISYKIEN